MFMRGGSTVIVLPLLGPALARRYQIKGKSMTSLARAFSYCFAALLVALAMGCSPSLTGDQYAYRKVLSDDLVPSALIIAAFFWPLIFFVVDRKNPSYRNAMVINICELLFCAGSAYIVAGIVLLGELRYGGYLALLAIAVYLMSTLAQIILRLWPRLRRT